MIFRQHQQQVELFGAEFSRLAGTSPGAAPGHQRSPRQQAFRRSLMPPAQNGLDARHQLARVKRLGEVIVRAQFQPQILSRRRRAGEHNDGTSE